MPPGHGPNPGDSLRASAQTLDAQVCGDLGARLQLARAGRRWTHADIGNRLLLSTAQVTGLERADSSAFHNPAYFASALRKYAALVEVDCPDTVLAPASPSNVRATAAPPSTAAWHRSRALWRAAAAVVLLIGAAALTVRVFQATTPAPPRPAAPLAPAAPVARAVTPPPEPPAKSVPAPAQPDPPAPPRPRPDEAAGLVTLATPGWVFVRYRDNSVTERVLQEGQSLALTSAPVYLAIGAGEGVAVTLLGRPVDVSPFRNGDEIRIGASDLAALTR